jgi:hypothetical protein
MTLFDVGVQRALGETLDVKINEKTSCFRALTSCQKDFPNARCIILFRETVVRVANDGVEVFPGSWC